MAEDLILQPPTCVFQFATPGELPEPRDPNDLIEGLIPEKGQVQLYGPPGIGKSTFALGMSAALAEGVEFIGRKCRKSRVCYQALEGQRGLVNRIRAIEKDTGRPLPDNLIVGFDELALHDVDSVCSFAWWLRKHGGIDVIVIDTMNRASPGIDENASQGMGLVLRGMGLLQKLLGATVIVIHHPGKDPSRGSRGHSSMLGGLDAQIELTKDGDVLRWRLSKSRDSEDDISGSFRLKQVEIGKSASGRPVTACVVEPVENCLARTEREVGPAGANQVLILDAIRELLVEQRVQSELGADESAGPAGKGLPMDEVVAKVKSRLTSVDSRHQKSRAREATNGLVRLGLLVLKDNWLSLPC